MCQEKLWKLSRNEKNAEGRGGLRVAECQRRVGENVNETIKMSEKLTSRIGWTTEDCRARISASDFGSTKLNECVSIANEPPIRNSQPGTELILAPAVNYN